jgi:hypothetical protein
MGDRSYMQVTIYNCPTRRRKVAELLDEYVGLEFEDTVYDPPLAVGERYKTEEIVLGSMNELAGRLIDLAPRCSFIGWQDPFEGELGEFIAYCPRWGRFDGNCTGHGEVVLGHQELTAITDDPSNAYLARDTMLRLHAGDMIPAQLAAWQSRPGAAEAIEVACGVPWRQHAKGIKAPKVKRQAWASVIDRQHQEAAQARHARLAEHAGNVGRLGLPIHAQALRDATDPAQAAETARAAATACAAILEPLDGARPLLTSLLGKEELLAVRQALDPFRCLPGQLRNWADWAEQAHAGRRRP